jgi:hypothetical protein
LAALGFGIAVYYRQESGASHFATYHSAGGLLIFTLLTFQVIIAATRPRFGARFSTEITLEDAWFPRMLA